MWTRSKRRTTMNRHASYQQGHSQTGSTLVPHKIGFQKKKKREKQTNTEQFSNKFSNNYRTIIKKYNDNKPDHDQSQSHALPNGICFTRSNLLIQESVSHNWQPSFTYSKPHINEVPELQTFYTIGAGLVSDQACS